MKDGHSDDGHGSDDHGDDHAAKDDHGGEHAGHVAPTGAIFIAPDNHVLHDAHYAPKWVKVSPLWQCCSALSWRCGSISGIPKCPDVGPMHSVPCICSCLNKWYFDEIYDAIFVRPAQALGRFLWKRGDENTIDGTINGVAMGIIPFFTRLAGRAQSGYIFTYALAMVLGIVVLITWMTFSGGAH